MASPFDRIMNTVRPHLPGAVDDAIKQELFLACDDFFKRSNVWRDKVDVIQRARTNTAEFMPFAGRVQRLMAVLNVEGRPVYGVIISEPGVLKFRHTVPSDTDYTAIFALTVNDPTARDAYPIVPFEIVEEYTAELISGLLSRMLAQPSKPYTNMTLAQYHLVSFRSAAARAKNEDDIGKTYASSNWRYPRNFA